MPKLSTQQVTHILTCILVLAWIGTAIARIWVEWPEAKILDDAMPLILAYWFASTAVNATRKNGNGVSA